MSNDSERTYGAAAEVSTGDSDAFPFGITVRFPPNTDGATRLHVAVVLSTYGASDICEYQSTEVLPACVTATIPAALLHRVLNDLPPRLFLHYGSQEFHR